ncbi:MAG: hypothetical protein D8M58_05840 [Calditrichaeota bacterium]|nr:MAG: hypothetical protein DWQ03_20665 [Calditrichota bacterium]MBL1204899.1 hypothetical protein [Calditrichota bacterium]NOG44728.1 hypothetical protein [Calditrichota bacterium]
MNTYFFISGILAFIVGFAHSLLGERFFLPRLRQKELKTDIGTEKFVNRTLRGAWHLATLASWSSAVLLIVFAFRPLDDSIIIVGRVMSNFYLFSGILSVFMSHGRHLVWIIFFILSLITWLGTY